MSSHQAWDVCCDVRIAGLTLVETYVCAVLYQAAVHIVNCWTSELECAFTGVLRSCILHRPCLEPVQLRAALMLHDCRSCRFNTAGSADSPFARSPAGSDLGAAMGAPTLSPKNVPRKIPRSPFKARARDEQPQFRRVCSAHVRADGVPRDLYQYRMVPFTSPMASGRLILSSYSANI